MNELIIAINALWLWCCFVPALLGLALFLIKIGSRSSNKNTLAVHKHNWEHDRQGSTVDIPPVEPNPKQVGNNPKSWPSNWFGIFHDKYVCKECGEEKTETHRELY